MRHSAIITTFSIAASLAAQDTFPLPASALPGSTNAQEHTAPFLAPFRTTQRLVTDRQTLTAQGLPATLGNWDMVAFDASGRFLFFPPRSAPRAADCSAATSRPAPSSR